MWAESDRVLNFSPEQRDLPETTQPGALTQFPGRRGCRCTVLEREGLSTQQASKQGPRQPHSIFLEEASIEVTKTNKEFGRRQDTDYLKGKK